MMKNILTVDVEEWFQVYNLREAIPRVNWDMLPSRLDVGVYKLLDMLDRYSCRATFFVLGWVAERKPGTIREIARRGHEIACHGWDHKPVTGMSPDEFHAETSDSLKVLSDITGTDITGYRASNFSIDTSRPHALETLADLGFQYDSSIFPFRRGRYGTAGFPRGPVRLVLPGGVSLVEFPLPTVRLPGGTLPVAGGGYLRLFPYRFTRLGIHRMNSEGIPAVVYLHPWELDPDQPRLSGGSRLKKWMHYQNLKGTEGILERLLGEFRCYSMSEAYDTVKGGLSEYRI